MRAKLVVWDLCLFMLLTFWVATPGLAQSGAGMPPAGQRIDGTVPRDDADANREQIMRDMAKKANLERHAALKTDTDKLLKLATELKASVDKSNENVLSLEVLKKAEEIEKLAHSVKEKMKAN